MQPFLRFILRALPVAVIYFCLARLGLSLPKTMGVSPVWVSAGFAIFVVWRLGYWFLIPLFIASFLVRFLTGSQLQVATLVALANVIAWATAAKSMHLCSRAEDRLGEFTRPISIMVGALAGSCTSGLLGPIAMVFAGIVPAPMFLPAAYTWWSRNLIGTLTTLPLIFILEGIIANRQPLLHKCRESFFSLFLAVAFSALFYGLLSHGHGVTFVFLVLPFMVLISNFAANLTSYLTFIGLLAVAVVMTCLDHGPLQWGPTTENLANLNLFFSAVSTSTLFICTFKYMPARRRSFAVMFASSLVASVVIWSLIEGQRRHDDDHASRLIEVQTEEIQSRMRDHQSLLNASASFWRTYKSEGRAISPKTWHVFAEGLALAQHTPSRRTVGLIDRVPKSSIIRFLAQQRAFIPSFQIRPYENAGPVAPSTDDYVVTNPPSHIQNALAVGRDMATEPIRRKALEYTVEHHQDKMSDPFPLFTAPLGFGIFHPLFEGERSVGWVHSLMTFDDFFGSVGRPGKDEIGWSISYEDNQSFIVYRTHPAAELASFPTIRDTTFPLVNTSLHVRWYQLPSFASSLGPSAIWIFVFIVLLSIALTAMTTNLELVKSRAEQMAEKISHDLEKHRVAIFHSSKMSSLGHMAAGIAHEINNPLTIIMGLTHMILMDFERTRSPIEPAFGMSQIGRLEKINKTVERISSIIRGLQSFSRSGQALPFKPTAIKQITNTVFDLCGQKFQNSGVDLRVGQLPDIEVPVVSVQIEQVLMNLLINSFDAIQNLDEKWVEINFEIDKSNLAILITDSGPGLPIEIANRIMEPFFTTKPLGKGTGLGLSICRGILESHNGQLIYVKDYSHTRFRIEIPLKQARPREGYPITTSQDPSIRNPMRDSDDITASSPRNPT